MLFSIGDLITFLVVLLILAIYRALDRNNRSLEKLKRFSDRITENLSGLVEQKTSQMKELSHELQASLKTGNELIVRAGGVEGQLQGKAEQVEAIQSRLTEYDRALKELASMSARVDKNLLKLRDESAFVDGVSRRIGESAARLEKMEKQIPEIEKTFSARTREALESARAETMKTAETRVAALAAAALQSEQKMKELAQAVARQDAHTRQAQEQGIAALTAAVDKARAEALKAVDGKVGALSGSIAQSEQKVKDFSTYVSRLEARADQSQTERVAVLTKMLEEARGKIMRGVEEKAAALADALARSEQKVKEFSASVAGREARDAQLQEKRLASLGQALQAARAELASAAEKNAGTLEEVVAKSEQTVKDFTAYVGELEARAQISEQERTANLEKSLEAARAAAVSTMDAKVAVLEQAVTAVREKTVGEVEAKVAALEKTVDATAERSVGAVASRVTAFAQSLDAARTGAMGAVEAKVAEFEKTVDIVAAQTVGVVEEKVAALQKTVDAATGKTVSAVEARVAALTQGLEATRAGALGAVEEKVSQLEKTVDAVAGRTVSAVETQVAALTRTLEAARAGALGAVEEKVEELEKTVDTVAERTVGAVEAKVTAFEKALDAARGNALSGIETKVAALHQVVTAAQDKAIGDATARVTALARTIDEAREGAVDLIVAKASGLEKSIDAARDKAVGALETRATSVTQGFEAARGAAMSDVQKNVSTLEGAVAASQRKVADFSSFITDLQARQGQMEKERIAELSATLDAFETDLRDRLAAAARRGETLEDEVFGRLSARIQSDEASLAKSIETIEARLADYQGDVDYRVKSLEDSTRDIDALRASLTQAMDKTAAVARAEMKELTSELAVGWKAEVAVAEGLQKKMQDGMGELETRLAALKERSYQDAEKQLSAFEEEFFADLRTRSTATQEKFQAWQSEMEKRAAGFEESLREQLAGAVQRGEALKDEMLARVSTRIQSDESALSRSIDGVDARIGELQGDVDARVKSLEEASVDVEEMRQSISKAIEESTARARQEIKGLSAQMAASWNEEAAAAAVLQKQLQAGTAELEAQWAELKARSSQETEKKLAAFETEFFTDLRARTSATQEKFTTWQSEMEKRAIGFESDLSEKIAGAARKGEALKDEVLARVTTRIQADEAAFAKSIETFETRLADYQGDVDYRVKSLEEANQDVEALRASLTQTMDEMAAGVRAEMKDLAAQLAAGWKSEIVAAGTLQEQLRAGMEELGGRVAELQARAYQEAEKKLSAFEEEFFADLRARSSVTQEKFQTWQSELEKRALGFETDLKERVAASEESIQALRDALRAEVDKARKDASASFDKELGGVRDVVEAGTRKMHREIEVRLKELGTELESGRKELTDLFEASRTEVTVWEGRAKQQLAEAELAIADRISTLSTEAAGSIGNIRDEFAAQKEDLLVSTNEERIALRKELAGMGEAISSFDANLKKTTDTAMETLRGQMDTFQVESQKKMRELQTEVEGRIKEHKQLLAETRDKSEAMQDKLFGKIEESYRLLSVNLGEIDKRVKSFTAQTRLFERADSMKAGLEAAIEEMKKEMAQLSAARPEVAELEQQLARTKKTADEVSTKVTRFLSEKRRIEDMDGEFKKIITLSRDVDLKLDTLSASNDALQQIQAKIRQFEEIGKTVEGGFERLEKKKEIISVTSEGVDRNFQRLEGIEKSLQDADRTASELSGQVQSLRGELEALATNKKDADSVMDTVGRLGSVLTDLEARLEKAQSSREWMARTETRFEEIGRQAQEQVRLLESILKAETKKEKGERGAPPLDKRETVIKLSHQGWSVQEIARVTQLSRGEVELILELAPKV